MGPFAKKMWGKVKINSMKLIRGEKELISKGLTEGKIEHASGQQSCIISDEILA